jgi:hypothetical protein
MGTPDYSKFKELLRNAVTAHFQALVRALGDDKCNGYSLYTSDDVQSIGPVANRASAVKAKPGEAQYIYYRYSADEWSEWDDFGLFEDTNALIAEYATGDDYCEEVAPKILQSSVEVLSELKASGIFRAASADLFLVLWVSDSATRIVWESAALLNRRDQFGEFAREFSPPNEE